MADRPILFSAPMVRAILDGRKSQTRRIIEPCTDAAIKPGDILASWPADQVVRQGERFRPRFAKGDRLWCRESFWVCEVSGHGIGVPFLVYDEEWTDGLGAKEPKPAELRDWVGTERFGKRPGIHMPRWASRLTLTVTDVRVERLQAISEADAIAEGARQFHDIQVGWGPGGKLNRWSMEQPPSTDHCLSSARWAFANYFAKLNGEDVWNDNPWVVALTFSVERKNIDG